MARIATYDAQGGVRPVEGSGRLDANSGPYANAGQFFKGEGLDLGPLGRGLMNLGQGYAAMETRDGKLWAMEQMLEVEKAWSEKLSNGSVTPDNFDQEYGKMQQELGKKAPSGVARDFLWEDMNQYGLGLYKRSLAQAAAKKSAEADTRAYGIVAKSIDQAAQNSGGDVQAFVENVAAPGGAGDRVEAVKNVVAAAPGGETKAVKIAAWKADLNRQVLVRMAAESPSNAEQVIALAASGELNSLGLVNLADLDNIVEAVLPSYIDQTVLGTLPGEDGEARGQIMSSIPESQAQARTKAGKLLESALQKNLSTLNTDPVKWALANSTIRQKVGEIDQQIAELMQPDPAKDFGMFESGIPAMFSKGVKSSLVDIQNSAKVQELRAKKDTILIDRQMKAGVREPSLMSKEQSKEFVNRINTALTGGGDVGKLVRELEELHPNNVGYALRDLEKSGLNPTATASLTFANVPAFKDIVASQGFGYGDKVKAEKLDKNLKSDLDKRLESSQEFRSYLSIATRAGMPEAADVVRNLAGYYTTIKGMPPQKAVENAVQDTLKAKYVFSELNGVPVELDRKYVGSMDQAEVDYSLQALRSEAAKSPDVVDALGRQAVSPEYVARNSYWVSRGDRLELYFAHPESGRTTPVLTKSGKGYSIPKAELAGRTYGSIRKAQREAIERLRPGNGTS